VEYNYKQSLFDAQSNYQRVEVVETVDHGRMLILDSDKNLSEADTVSYTHTLMGLPEVSDGSCPSKNTTEL
jgi:spermidine synthase